ncbi:hypothetical protein Ngar_c08850 [Candidatus Nitrososphaera gargensis Ga9.2]|uniref:Uncharacterized protein n=2 Tax=Candidatus Nitrososphaera gargensis TaxID=497727 RepID=K0IIF2_NITGG|nr:hypothetical protein Ngar_c08850 [Candidatus Nitrososphaera gargensis Ga9.2]
MYPTLQKKICLCPVIRDIYIHNKDNKVIIRDSGKDSSKMPEKRNNDVDNNNNIISNTDRVLIPSTVIKQVIETSLNMLMPTFKDQVLLDMRNAGLRLDDEIASYSLSQVRDYFHLAFGADAADLLLDVVRNTLEKTGQFKKYG